MACTLGLPMDKSRVRGIVPLQVNRREDRTIAARAPCRTNFKILRNAERHLNADARCCLLCESAACILNDVYNFMDVLIDFE